MSNDNQTQIHADLAGLRADVQATNRNIERIAQAMEKTLADHEVRLRTLETERSELKGTIKFIQWASGAGVIAGGASVATLVARISGAA